MHLVSIARHDTDKLATVVLQTLEQRVNGLGTEGVLIVGLQRVSLIDEKHTTHGRINKLIGLDGRLSAITSYKFATVGLNQLTTREDAQLVEHLGHDARHGGLTRTRIAREHIMLALEGVGLAALHLQVQIGSQILDFRLNRLQTHHSIQLGQALGIVHHLGCLIGYILHIDGHQLFIGKLS